MFDAYTPCDQGWKAVAQGKWRKSCGQKVDNAAFGYESCKDGLGEPARSKAGPPDLGVVSVWFTAWSSGGPGSMVTP
jgi:hypothetical protein